MFEFLKQIDIDLFFLINRTGQNDFFDFFMPFMSALENFYIPLVILWLYMIIKKSAKTRTVAIMILLLISLSEWLSSDALKPLFDRPRPFHSLSAVHLYDRMHKTWCTTPELEAAVNDESRSMPSSHATNIFAAAFFLSVYFRKSWIALYLIATIVGYSRVYLGVHYPSDVIAGAFAGTLCGVAAMWPTNFIISLLTRKDDIDCKKEKQHREVEMKDPKPESSDGELH